MHKFMLVQPSFHFYEKKTWFSYDFIIDAVYKNIKRNTLTSLLIFKTSHCIIQHAKDIIIEFWENAQRRGMRHNKEFNMKNA